MRRTAAIALGFCLLIGVSAADPPATFALAGRVTNDSGKYPVYVALWDSAGFLDRPVRQLKLPLGSARSFRFDVPRGRWALSAFEDRNGNGELDLGLFGPKEPTGFWRPFHAWRKPRFDDVATTIDHDLQDADVALR
jgi:uncharacterized protein (DUF2141 family)